jgi:cell division protein FtsX
MLAKTYNIKLEDKAAFLNRLEKVGVLVDSFEITDNLMDNSFEITFTNPEDIEKVKEILKKSPKIDQITELIYNMVRGELSK